MNKMDKYIYRLATITELIQEYDEKQDYSEQEKSAWIEELAQIVRKEKSLYFEKYFSSNLLAEKILLIFRTSSKNEKLAVNTLSLLGNMIKRYNLAPTNELFRLFLSLKETKKANYQVSLFITYFPQFNEYQEKWPYILSIPTIPPKKLSKRNFYIEIKKRVAEGESIPVFYKEQLIELFKTMIHNETVAAYKTEYRQLLNVIEASGIESGSKC